MRRPLLALAVAVVLVACSTDEGRSNPRTSTSPSETSGPDQSGAAGVSAPQDFLVTLEGEAGAGTASEPFAREARVFFRAAIPGGDNVVEVGVATLESPLGGNLGALWFGTNLSISADISGSAQVISSEVDIAAVTATSDVVTVVVDGDATGLPTARVDYLNIFNVTSGPTAQIHNVLTGTITIQVTGPDTVRGTIDLRGSSGSGGPEASSHYTATFTGSRTE